MLATGQTLLMEFGTNQKRHEQADDCLATTVDSSSMQPLRFNECVTNPCALGKGWWGMCAISPRGTHCLDFPCFNSTATIFNHPLVSREGNYNKCIFFHKYGRRVGMVRRSSLKERKNNQMVEKRTKTTQQQTKQTKQSTGRASTILQSFLCAEVKTGETKTILYQWA